ncbi:MAG: cation:proton antiporter [Myxococcota bacterium]
MDGILGPMDRLLLAGPLVSMGVLVLVALIGGEVAARWLRLSRIVGYAATGMALGALGVVPAELRDQARVAIDLCVGAILFELGARIDLGWLRRAPWLAALAVGESLVAGAALYWMLSAGFGLPAALAACGAALGVSTSPAVVLRVARDLGAQGQVTERMLMLSATNTAIAVVALAWITPALSADAALTGSAIAVSLWVVSGSLFAAGVLAALGLLVFRVVGKRRESQVAAAFGLIALASGLGVALHWSTPLTCLALGASMRATDHGQRMMAVDFGKAGQLIYVLLFALVGANLDLRALAGAGAAALAFLATRAAAKGVAVLALARATRQPARQAALLALTLQPMFGLGVVLAQDAARVQPALAETVVPLVLAAVVVFEVLGPLCVQVGLRLAGEAEPSPA